MVPLFYFVRNANLTTNDKVMPNLFRRLWPLNMRS
jgi:hypothetical protein